MNDIEERLTGALNARADLVRDEDLAPIETPEVRRPRATPYLLAAAACAALVTVPLLVMGLGDDDEPGPATPSPSPSPSQKVEDDRGADWPVLERRFYDLDGDGTKERVRLLSPDPDGMSGPLRVETELSGSGPTHVVLEGDMLRAAIIGTPDMDGDGDLELLVFREFVTDEMGRAVTVLTLDGGALVETTSPESPRIADTLDSQMHGRGWWWRGGILHTYRSVQPFESDGHDVTFPDEFRADVWTWSLVGTDLVAEPAGEWCALGNDSGNPVPCDADPAAGEDFFPLVDSVMGVGDSFEVDLDGSGPDTVALIGTGDARLGEDVEDGQVELMVTYHDGRELSVGIPAGGSPLVSTMPVDWDGDAGILVRQEAGDGTIVRVYGVRDGALTELPVSDEVPLGNQFAEDSGRLVTYWTWQGADGDLYTARQGEDEESSAVWQWGVNDGGMEPEPVGVWCIDRDVNQPSARPC